MFELFIDDIMLISRNIWYDGNDAFRIMPTQVQSTTQFHEHVDQIPLFLTYVAPRVMAVALCGIPYKKMNEKKKRRPAV